MDFWNPIPVKPIIPVLIILLKSKSYVIQKGISITCGYTKRKI